MSPKVTDVIAYEIKKDIAERYFGFRKLIEEDKLDLADKIRQYVFILEKRISFDLIRIYFLLKDEEIIRDFLALIALDEKLFYDRYLISSNTIRKRVFEGIRTRGLTKSSRFKNLVMDCYDRLVIHSEQYRGKFEELKESQEIISEEIKLFYEKNDLGSILGFLRSLGDPSASQGMEGGMEVGMAQSLEKKMVIEPPESLDPYLPLVPPLPPLNAVKKDLKKLTGRAYRLHNLEALDFFTGKRPAAER